MPSFAKGRRQRHWWGRRPLFLRPRCDFFGGRPTGRGISDEEAGTEDAGEGAGGERLITSDHLGLVIERVTGRDVGDGELETEDGMMAAPEVLREQMGWEAGAGGGGAAAAVSAATGGETLGTVGVGRGGDIKERRGEEEAGGWNCWR